MQLGARGAPACRSRLGARATFARRPLAARAPAPVPRVAALILVATFVAAIHPLLLVAAAGVAAVAGWARRRSTARAARDALIEELPDAVALLAVAVGAGASPRQAVEAVAHHGSGPLASAFADALVAVDGRGARLADELAAVPERVGDEAGPVARPLVSSLRYGTTLGPTLALVGRDLREVRRQRAEERLRRIPVKLIFPLVCCTLPAFVVLTIVPLVASAFGQLHLS